MRAHLGVVLQAQALDSRHDGLGVLLLAVLLSPTIALLLLRLADVQLHGAFLLAAQAALAVRQHGARVGHQHAGVHAGLLFQQALLQRQPRLAIIVVAAPHEELARDLVVGARVAVLLHHRLHFFSGFCYHREEGPEGAAVHGGHVREDRVRGVAVHAHDAQDVEVVLARLDLVRAQ